MLCDKVTGSVQRLLRDSCNYVSLCSDLGSVRSVSHRLWGGLLQLQRQIKYGCNFSLVLILSNVPVYIGPYRVAYVVCIYACLRILHQFNVLLEISVALVNCILAVMPSNIL